MELLGQVQVAAQSELTLERVLSQVRLWVQTWVRVRIRVAGKALALDFAPVETELE